jgi:competence protein ComEC
VVRAAAMGILYLVAVRLGRATYAPASLAASAFFMTLLNPHTLWDVGFQLSFAATVGLVLYTEPLERAFARALGRITTAERAEKIVGLISEALLVTLAAQISTTPIILSIFGRLSLITLATNFLILPVQSYVMVLGGIALLLGLIFRPLGQVVGWVAWVFLTYTIEMVRLTARVPFASVPVKMEGWMVWGCYALLAGLTWWFKQTKERRAELWQKFASNVQTKFILGAAVVLLILAFFSWRSLPDGKLHVAFLDVGQGDAIFIQTPSGRQILVDGGPSDTALLSQLGSRMPFWDRSIDLVLLTHPESDHVTGLIAVLERYRVDAVVFREVTLDSATYARWLEAVEAEEATIYRGEGGLHLALDAGLEMVVLHPGAELEKDANNNSVVTRLTYGQVSLLFPGDIESEVEAQLVRAQRAVPRLRSTVLKVPHHGSCSSTTQAFLDAVNPEVAIISVGADNRFGHPCDEVLQRLDTRAEVPPGQVEGQGRSVHVYRTDEHGVVEVVSDGTQMWIETAR